MEITRSSFKKSLPLVVDAIKSCTFISIDGEYSGLHTNKNKSISNTDDIQQRYEKLRDSVQSFSFLQFGMTAFTWDDKTNSFDVKPFSFYLFSDPSKLMGMDRRFTFQASSASFLAEYKFDFNKVFYGGIQFINRSEEDTFRKRSVDAINGKNENVKVPPECIELVDSSMAKVDHWLNSQSNQDLELSPMNSFQRLIMYQQIRSKYADSLVVVKGSNDVSGLYPLVIKRFTTEEREAYNSIEEERFENELQDQIGFRKVIDSIIEHRKPIVAHNSMLDIFHMYAQFVERLPEEVTLGKKKINSVFPLLFDTKLISRDAILLPIFQEGSLGDIYSKVQEAPFMDAEVSLSYSDDFKVYSHLQTESKFHDAGFDSFCTGFIFLKMMKYLFHKNIESLEDSLQIKHLANDNNLFQYIFSANFHYINKLNMMRSNYKYFDLLKPEFVLIEHGDSDQNSNLNLFQSFWKQFKSNNDHTAEALNTSNLVIVFFNESHSDKDIFETFSPFGQFSVHKLNETSIMLEFITENDSFKEIFELDTNGRFSILTYDSFTASPIPGEPQLKKLRTEN